MSRDFALARRLREIASKVRCLPPPSARDPEAFHINRSEEAKQIELVADELFPLPRPREDIRRPVPPNIDGLPRSPRRR